MSEKNSIWYRDSILEYLLLYVVVIVVLVFIIPRENADWCLVYVASLISYGMLVFFMYCISIKRNYKNRDMRLVFIILIAFMMISQIFHYYTIDDVIALITLSISLILVVYLIIRGFDTPFVVMMLVPLIFIIYYIVIQIIYE